MFAPLARAIDQLDDPAVLRVLAASLALSAAVFGVLCAAAAYGLHHTLAGTLAGHAWLAWLAGLLGGFAVLASGLWLFLPAAVVIASLFMDPVCRAVERRWYPGLQAARGASLAAQLWDGAVVGVLVGALSLVSLVLALLVPGIGLLLGWAITAWALGRGLFVAVAMRRMGRAEAGALYLRHRWAVLAQGAALALAGYVPVANLLIPVLGTACMVHVLMQATDGGRRGESGG
jgi:uncharacterized protein involved in cysteine biosynthesis